MEGASPTPPGAKKSSATATAERYKRLLGLARKGLEDTTRQLQERDEQLQILQARLQTSEEGLRRAQESQAASGTGPLEVVDVLARVENDGAVHLLCEFAELEGPQWRSFKDAERANDFIRRDNGEPVAMPAPHLPPQEVNVRLVGLQGELKATREEYRRYRVRTQISAKQQERNAQEAQQTLVHTSDVPNHAEAREVIRKRDQDWQERVGAAEEARQAATREGNSWRKLYEQERHQREELMRRGVETALAASWRKRYEQVLRDKERLVSLLRLFNASGDLDEELEDAFLVEEMNGSNADMDGIAQTVMKVLAEEAAKGDDRAHVADLDSELERSTHVELCERLKAMQQEFQRYQKHAEDLIREQRPPTPRASSIARSSPSSYGSGMSIAAQAAAAPAKLAYAKNLLLQHWLTPDEAVRKQTEQTLATVLEFSAAQRGRLDSSRAARASWFPAAFPPAR